MIIAQPAGRILHVRLEVEDGIAHLAPAFFIHLRKPAHQVLPLAQDELWQNLLPKPAEKLEIARQEATVKKRNVEFEIIAMKQVTLFQGAGGRAKFQPYVPHILAELADDVLLFRAGKRFLEQEQKVDIRMRIQ